MHSIHSGYRGLDVGPNSAQIDTSSSWNLRRTEDRADAVLLLLSQMRSHIDKRHLITKADLRGSHVYPARLPYVTGKNIHAYQLIVSERPSNITDIPNTRW
jgi:hypothetical protein